MVFAEFLAALENPLVSRVPDLPLTVALYVFIEVDAGPFETPTLVENRHHVLEVPRPACLGFREHLDLGGMHVVFRDKARRPHRLRQELHDRLATLEGIGPGVVA